MTAGRLRASALLVTFVACALVAACASPLPTRAQLLSESYELIDQLYVQPVQTSRVAEASLGALTKLDAEVVIEVEGAELVLKRGRKVLRRIAIPSGDDWRGWGNAAALGTAAAAATSPAISHLADETVDTALIDGAVAALDRFSRYVPPEVVRENALADKEDEDLVQTRSAVGLGGHETERQGRGSPVFGPPAARPPSAPTSSLEVRVEDDVVIARITRFTKGTGLLLRKELSQAASDVRPRGVILDLRDDPGGDVRAAAEVADVFMANGVIVTLQARDPRHGQLYRAVADGGIYERLPVVVLVNGRSASAAEIVAAALQAAHRAVVVGSSTFGKGTAQRIIPLPNGAELWITSAYTWSPAGYLLQGRGVVPDVCIGLAGRSGDRVRRFTELSARRRASLTDAEWSELRAACPAPARSSERDRELDAAKRILGGLIRPAW